MTHRLKHHMLDAMNKLYFTGTILHIAVTRINGQTLETFEDPPAWNI